MAEHLAEGINDATDIKTRSDVVKKTEIVVAISAFRTAASPGLFGNEHAEQGVIQHCLPRHTSQGAAR